MKDTHTHTYIHTYIPKMVKRNDANYNVMYQKLAKSSINQRAIIPYSNCFTYMSTYKLNVDRCVDK